MNIKFLEKTEKDDVGDCWYWIASANEDGYGWFVIDNKKWKAHRYAWVSTHGSIPKETPWVLHHCHNARCVNPEHLYLGTPQNNTDDMVNAGRSKFYGGVNNIAGARWRKLIDSQIQEIKELSRQGKSNPEIGKMFGVSRHIIYNVVNSRSYRLAMEELCG